MKFGNIKHLKFMLTSNSDSIFLVLPGGACPTGGERCLGGSTCQQGLCTCPLGTVVQGSECAVVERAVAGQPCSASKRCTGYAICVQVIFQLVEKRYLRK